MTLPPGVAAVALVTEAVVSVIPVTNHDMVSTSDELTHPQSQSARDTHLGAWDTFINFTQLHKKTFEDCP